MAAPGAGHDEHNAAVERFRGHEYPMLKDNVYLDHAGTTLYSRSLVDRVAVDMMGSLFGNPHAASPSSVAASERIESVRQQMLQFFGADPAEFDLVFVANATAGAKLVTEAFRALPGGFSYAYHQACHTSLVGVREEARSSACVPSQAVEDWINWGACPLLQESDTHSDNVLFAYPAQSNMDGQRFPLSWADGLRRQQQQQQQQQSVAGRVWTMLDAAAFASTSPLDLSRADTAPDFVLVSFYKIFGFPDLGGLLVRRPAEPVFAARRYFGGGTVDMVVCAAGEQWHASKTQTLHERLEDGTLPVHSIAALGAALETHTSLFGSMVRIAAHTAILARRLRDGLAGLRHGNGTPVCAMYASGADCGPVVAFNLRNDLGAWIRLVEFDKLAALKKVHVRTGSMCNPGGIAAALNLAPWEMRRNFSAGLRCGGDDDDSIVGGKPTGVIRASLGAMSTQSDVDRFLEFIDAFYRDPRQDAAAAAPIPPPPTASSLAVVAISVYPIKSCGAFAVPPATRWEVRPEGLAWDREWCLVHRSTGRALSQKQYPQMVLVRPRLDFVAGVLRVSYGEEPEEVSVPLSDNPAMFASPTSSSFFSASRAPRVCGEEIAAHEYTSKTINGFFSRVLGVPCVLARFPPGGQGRSMRHAKAHLQKYQTTTAPPSPPDSDTERHSSSNTQSHRILLANESPILAIHLASVRALNEAIRTRRPDHEDVSPAVFRANVVVDAAEGQSAAYSEDGWARLRIGGQSFRTLGSCRRCHMVCVNQVTGARRDEPFLTLAQTRRFDGKVFFGTHMGHEPAAGDSREQQHATIAVGDVVEVEPRG